MKRREQEELFKQAADELAPMFWRLASGFADGFSDREDLVQEILLQVWLSLPRFQARAKLSTWAYRVAMNVALSWRRKRPPAGPSADELEFSGGDLNNQIQLRDELKHLLQTLRKLSEPDRVILLLALEEYSGREMAEFLDIGENAAQVRLHRARKRLEDALMEGGVR